MALDYEKTYARQMESELLRLGLKATLDPEGYLRLFPAGNKGEDGMLVAEMDLIDPHLYHQLPASAAAVSMAACMDPEGFLPDWISLSSRLTVLYGQSGGASRIMNEKPGQVLTAEKLIHALSDASSRDAEARHALLRTWLTGSPYLLFGGQPALLGLRVRTDTGYTAVMPITNRLAEAILRRSPYDSLYPLVDFVLHREEKRLKPTLLTQSNALSPDIHAFGVPVPGESAIAWISDEEEPLALIDTVRCQDLFPDGCALYPVAGNICLTTDSLLPADQIREIGHFVYDTIANLSGAEVPKPLTRESQREQILTREADGSIRPYALYNSLLDPIRGAYR